MDERAFLDLCEFAENVIKRRIEQLAEVAMVDVTGLVERQLQIVPDPGKLAVLGFSIEDIENVLAQNNVEPGSMTVRDGYYEYNIKFSTLLRTEEDVKGILLRKGRTYHPLGRLLPGRDCSCQGERCLHEHASVPLPLPSSSRRTRIWKT